MDAHRQREIARKGGRAAHEKGKAHEFTSDEARAAGRKGGEKVSTNRKHMAEIGRRGGRSSASRRRPGGNEEASAPVQGRGEAASMNPASMSDAMRDVAGRGRSQSEDEHEASAPSQPVRQAEERPTPASENI
jgi:general stress protein YciG